MAGAFFETTTIQIHFYVNAGTELLRSSYLKIVEFFPPGPSARIAIAPLLRNRESQAPLLRGVGDMLESDEVLDRRRKVSWPIFVDWRTSRIERGGQLG